MSFIDELTVDAKAGRGGDGVVRWLHLKGKEFSGPAGGNGGDGGDFYIRGVRDMNLLSRYRGEKRFSAGDGEPGENQNKTGKKGKDFILELPIGSVVSNRNTKEEFELLKEHQTFLILKGGRGGAGNAVFKSSVNRSPQESTMGGRGEEATFDIELRLIADAGLVGLPNAGKTSLLNVLTRTQGKVGSYAFTTLDPNLGALYGYIIADIPGLIEGASVGKGLGFKFLRHIGRTRLLVHCVSLESSSLIDDYKSVRKEIESFENGLLKDKEELIVLTKSDTQDSAFIQQMKDKFKKIGKMVEVVSILNDEELKQFQDRIISHLRVL